MVEEPGKPLQLILFKKHPRKCPVETLRPVVVHFELDGRHNAKVVAGASQGPEEVGMRLGGCHDEAAVGKNHSSLEDLVGYQSVETLQIAVASAEHDARQTGTQAVRSDSETRPVSGASKAAVGHTHQYACCSSRVLGQHRRW